MAKPARSDESLDRRAEILWFLGLAFLGVVSWIRATLAPPPAPLIHYPLTLWDGVAALYVLALFVVFVVPFLYARSFYRPYQYKVKATKRRFLPGVSRREIGIWLSGIALVLICAALFWLTAPEKAHVDPPWNWVLLVVRILVSGGAALGLFIFLVCPFLWESAYGHRATEEDARIRVPRRSRPV